MIKILKIESGFLKNRVLIEAQNDCVFAEGEIVEFSSVCNSDTARQFLWYYI